MSVTAQTPRASFRKGKRPEVVKGSPPGLYPRQGVLWILAFCLLVAILSVGCTRSLLPVEVLQEITQAGDGPGSIQSPAEDCDRVFGDCAEQAGGKVEDPGKAGPGQENQASPTPTTKPHKWKASPTPDGSGTDLEPTQPTGAEATSSPTPVPTKPSLASPTPDVVATNTIVPTSTPNPGSPPPAPTDTPVPPSPTPTAVPPTQTPTPEESCASTGNAGFESTLIALINEERANRGIPALSADSRLRSAARAHSTDMACNDFFSHTGSDGSSPFSRIAAYGYSYSAAGENIYGGSGSYNSPYSAFNGWMNSPGHRAIMLDPTYIHVGIGYQNNPSSTYGGYFTADFGTP